MKAYHLQAQLSVRANLIHGNYNVRITAITTPYSQHCHTECNTDADTRIPACHGDEVIFGAGKKNKQTVCSFRFFFNTLLRVADQRIHSPHLSLSLSGFVFL